MRILIAALLSLTLVGCTTASHTARSSCAAPNAQMIIRYSDIEPSITAAGTPVSKTAGISHTVDAGQTLWAISKLYCVDVAELARANSISDSRSIEVGQVLKIPGSRTREALKTVNYRALRSATFVWPVSGHVVASFGSKADKAVNKGIDIKAREGMNVMASRGGKVVYCDSHLKGFGQTVIIDHADGFQTVYSYNNDIAVKVGDMVQQRDVIAKVGSSGRAKEPMLHFEIRKNGEPQNPEFYLSKERQ